MERSTLTKDIAGKPLVFKDYITAREAKAIEAVYLQNAKVDMAGTTPTFSDIDPLVQHNVEKKMIELLVVSYGDTKEGLVDVILDLPVEHYTDIVKTLDGIASPNAKKN